MQYAVSLLILIYHVLYFTATCICFKSHSRKSFFDLVVHSKQLKPFFCKYLYYLQNGMYMRKPMSHLLYESPLLVADSTDAKRTCIFR